MKKIRKTLLVTSVLALSLGLTACSANDNSSKSSSSTAATSSVATKDQVKFTVTIADKTNTYTVKKGTNLLDFAKDKLGAKDTSGFIDSIDGLKTSKTDKIYLMFKVNGKDSEVGAKDVTLKSGDKIEFYTIKG